MPLIIRRPPQSSQSSLTPTSIEQYNQEVCFVEDNYVNAATLMPSANNSGGGSSVISQSSVTLDSNNVMNFIMPTGPNCSSCRVSPGPGYVPGQWKATMMIRMLINSVTPSINTTNNAYFYAGFTSNNFINAPNTSAEVATIAFLYDASGVGIKVSNNTSSTIFRPPTAILFSPGVFYNIQLRVSKLTQIAQVWVNDVLVLKTNSTTNFPTYNSTSRRMGPVMQYGRVAADTVNTVPTLSVEYCSVLYQRNESAGEIQ